MPLFARCKHAAKIAQYQFFDGQFGRTVFDKNHRLEIRVVDDGYLVRHRLMQKGLTWFQDTFAPSHHFGWIKDISQQWAQNNVYHLREYLLKRLKEGKVYLKTLNLNTGEYYFRWVRPEEVLSLSTFVCDEREYWLCLNQGNPIVVSLEHRDIITG